MICIVCSVHASLYGLVFVVLCFKHYLMKKPCIYLSIEPINIPWHWNKFCRKSFRKCWYNYIIISCFKKMNGLPSHVWEYNLWKLFKHTAPKISLFSMAIKVEIPWIIAFWGVKSSWGITYGNEATLGRGLITFIHSTNFIPWRLPSTITRIKSCATAVADFQHPLNGVQGGEQKWDTLCLDSCG